MSNLEQIISQLRGRKAGRGWICHCPAHDDKKPSLSVGNGRGGRILVYCFGGCAQEEVIEALRNLGLWTSHGKEARRGVGL